VSVLRLGLVGATGRMGKRVKAACASSAFSSRAEVAAELGRGEDPARLAGCDAVIDFSSPAGTLSVIRAFERLANPPALAIGTTGFSDAEKSELEKYAARHPCLVASNFSTGVQALSKLLSDAAGLAELQGYRIGIRELHHVHTKDAPSGTALSLKALLPGKPVEVESIREGEIVGTHEITFTSDSDRIVLIHEAFDRGIFGSGAIETALKLVEKRASLPKKLLSLRDVF